MSNQSMHEDEYQIDEAFVRALLSAQFKSWSDLRLELVGLVGTENVIFKLGDDKCIRLPRRPGIVSQVIDEQRWLSFLAPRLPLDIPIPMAGGYPEGFYDSHWVIYPWLEGADATKSVISDLEENAVRLADFIRALHDIDATGGPATYRGAPLATRNSEVHKALDALHDYIDTKAALNIWNICLKAKPWEKDPVWIHSDLLPANLLVNRGRITAVLDFGMVGIGDPACDLLPAWSLFHGESREKFRQTLDIDEATWIRGQGWALSIGLIILPYYFETNPSLVRIGEKLIQEVLLEYQT